MNIMICGAGRIGVTMASLLSSAGYAVELTDLHAEPLTRLGEVSFATRVLDVRDQTGLRAALAEKDAVISACPYFLNADIATAARATATHYFDLTEDVETTRRIREIAAGAATVFMPQCGLAPGFVSVVGHHLAQPFSELRELKLRVGALPQFPSNALQYNLTWSTDGLINEYGNVCEAIELGAKRELLPLEGLERFAFDGIQYEAFNTSGGLGTLCETYAGRVQTLNYKTCRYPGHRDLVKLLMNDLRLNERRDLMKAILDHAVPTTLADVVVIFASATGFVDGRLVEVNYAEKIYGRYENGRQWSAIEITTASGLCAMIDLLAAGSLAPGFVRQEDVAFEDFIASRFGRVFDPRERYAHRAAREPVLR